MVLSLPTKRHFYVSLKIACSVSILLYLLFSSEVYSQEACGLMPAPNGDDIRCIGVNVDDALYIGTWGDGLYKTTNDATTVTKLTTGIRGSFISAITFSKTGTIYITTADSGCYKSVNAGNTWTEITNGTPLFGKSITCITGSSPAKDKLYMGTFGQGIFISSDGGATWTQSIIGLFNLDVTSITYNNDNTIEAGVYGAGLVGGMYDNLGGGDTNWFRRSNGIYGSKFINSFGKDRLGNLFVAINGNTAWMTDATNVWSLICNDNSTITDSNFTCITYANPKQFATAYDETIGTRSKGIWFYDNRVYQNWQQSPTVKSGGVNSIARKSNGTLYAAMSGRGLLMSTDNGLTWKDIGLFDFRGSTSLISAGSGGWVWVTPRAGGLYRSVDYGLSWSSNLYPTTSKIYLIKAFNNKIYLSTNDSTAPGLHISSDSGKTWSFTALATKKAIVSISFSPTNPNLMYCLVYNIPGGAGAATCQLYKSTNGGTTLTAVGGNLLGDLNSRIVCLDDNTLYVYQNNYQTGSGASTSITNRVFYSTNAGTSWTATSPFNATNTTKTIQDIQTDGSGNVYVGASDGLYKTTSGTASFTQLNNLNKKLTVDEVPFITRLGVKSSSEMYVGFSGDVGIYYTANGGSNWSNINASFNTCSIRDMTVGTENDIYFVASAAYRIVNPLKMGIPVQVSPVCESKGVSLHPTIVWNPSVRADMYEFQLTPDFDTTAYIEWVIQSPTTHKVYHTLRENTTYNWRVRGKANGSYSDWTDWCSFTTQGAAPKLIYPANLPDTLSKGIPVLCQFNWNQSDNCDRYHIQVAKDSLFKTLIFQKDTIADTTYLNIPAQKMPPLTKLWWRAMAWNSKYPNISNWSKPNQFLTTLAPPKLVNPVNNSTSELPTLTFKWDSVNTATSYEIQVANAKDTSFSNPAPDLTLAADELTHEITALEYNVKYCWRMRAFNPDGVSEWSIPYCFTTSLQGPANAVPANKTTCLDTLVGFSWTAVPKATKYTIQIGSDTNLTTKLIDTNITSTSFTKLCKFYTNYYWRVCAWVDSTQGKWIPTRIFKTGLEKATIKSPTNLENLTSGQVELRWNDVNNAKTYNLKFAKDKSLTNSVQTINNITVNSKTLFGLDSCKFYFWAVQASTPDCDGAWSDTLSFKTICNTSVNDYIADQYSVSIFPNPFSVSVNISFVTMQSGWTNVTIYNSAGSKIITLFDNELNFGEHKFDWVPTGQAKGIYFLNIKTKDYEIMREINFK